MRIGRRFGFLEPFALFISQHLTRILALSSGGNDVIVRSRDLNFKITELQRKFAITEELLVLPAIQIGVCRDTRIPLGNFINVVAVLFEKLKSTTGSDFFCIDDTVIPVDLKNRLSSRFKRLWQIYTHHRSNDRMR